MAEQQFLLWISAILITSALAPAVIAALVILYLKGRVRAFAAVGVLTGLTTIPFIWLEPQIHVANRHSVDAGGFIAIDMALLMMVVFVSVLIGFAIGAVLLYFRRRKQIPFSMGGLG